MNLLWILSHPATGTRRCLIQIQWLEVANMASNPAVDLPTMVNDIVPFPAMSKTEP
jgi:hypothetical protein